MRRHQLRINKFFNQKAFSVKSLNKLWRSLRLNSSTNELQIFHGKLKEELKSFRKQGKLYKKRENKVQKTISREINYKQIESFLSDNKKSSNGELAENLELSFEQLSNVVKTFKITEFEKEGFLNETEMKSLICFFDSRLNALKRQKRRDELKKKPESEKKKKKLDKKPERKKSIGSAGVYDNIKERGGLGKLIYNGMRK